jgi:putative membrane protein
MLYDNFQFWGVHLIWWIASILLLIGIFALSTLKGQKKEKQSPLDVLTSQYAEGIIDSEEYISKKKYLQNSSSVDEDFARIMNVK